MKKLLLLATIFLAGQLVFAQKKPAYTLFDSKGKRVEYGKMLKAAAVEAVSESTVASMFPPEMTATHLSPGLSIRS